MRKKNKTNWTPEKIEAELKKKIIGQDNYLYDLSICIWLHNQRREHFLRTGQRISKPKCNMLVIGKSGMGKTSTIQAAAELLDIPIVIEDASELRGSGWKGKQVSEIIRDIQEAVAKRSRKKEDAEFAIVVLDEIDKIFMDRTTDKSFSPVNNLLKFIEGTECGFGDGSNRVQMRTDNLLFICIGAFDGLEEIIEQRIKPKKIGFAVSDDENNLPKDNILKEVTTKDLVAYGVNEQFLGRFSLVTVMNELEREDYEDILLKSEISPIKQMDLLFGQEHGVSISISPKAAQELAGQVMHSDLGARALQREVMNLFKEALYEMPDHLDCNEYCLDYQDRFVIAEMLGERIMAPEKKRIQPYRISVEDRRCLSKVAINIDQEDRVGIMACAEEMFEPFEAENYSEYPMGGLTDLYDYMTIKQAQYFTAAAIAQYFVDEQCRIERSKHMAALLRKIRSLGFEKEVDAKEPLIIIKNKFLDKLQACSEEKRNEIREISWTVVYKFAWMIYQMDFADNREI
jgi:ATP-dependent Clp protease ATP-binding subunit ClpX